MAIVTEGLVGYYHYLQGFTGSKWNNIAPQGTEPNLDVSGAVVNSEGVYLDGIDDIIQSSSTERRSEITVELEVRIVQKELVVPLIIVADVGIIYSYSSTIDRDGFLFGQNAYGPINTSDYYIVSYVRDGTAATLYLNGVEIYSGSFIPFLEERIIIGSMSAYFSNISLRSAKIYNRKLTHDEILQNYHNGSDIGLDEGTPGETDPPKVNITNISSYKLSSSEGMNSSLVSFTFDKDVTEYKFNVFGTSHDTGINIVHETGTVESGVEVIQAVYYSDLVQEGENRINIYGRNSAGWTEGET